MKMTMVKSNLADHQLGHILQYNLYMYFKTLIDYELGVELDLLMSSLEV
jgi:hypothetical protein